MRRAAVLRLAAATTLLLAAGIVFSPLLTALAGPTAAGPVGDDGAAAVTSAEVMPALAASVGAAAVAGAVALVLGTGFALAAEHARPRARRAAWGVGVLAMLIPPYLVAEAWIVLLGPAGKISRPVAALLGFGPDPSDPLAVARFAVPGFVFTRGAVGAVMGGCLFPIVALAVAGAYRRTDRRLFDAARLARGRAGVFRVAARALGPPALGAALVVLAVALTEFGVPQMLRVRTIGESVYDRIQEGDLRAAAGLGLPLIPVVVGAGALGALVIARSRAASAAGLEGEVPRFEALPAGVGADLRAALATAVAALPAVVLPMIALTWLAVTAARPPESALGGHKVLRASGFAASLRGAWDLARDDALRTVALAALCATLATGLALAAARLAPRVRCGPLLGALAAGLAVPAPVVGLGLIVLWNRPATAAVYQGPAVVLLGWLARFLPVAVLLAQAALARVPRELEDAAALAGRGPLGRLVAVVLPGAAPGLAAAWVAVYVLSATELGATLLVAPPGRPLLAPSVVNLMRRGQDPEVAACQVLLLAVVALPLIPVSLAMVVARWRRRAARADRPAADPVHA